MFGKLIGRVLAPMVGLALVVSGAPTSASAGEDKGLCKADNGRVSIPKNFPLKACFDGKTLHLLNDNSMPVVVEIVGDTSSPRRYARGGAGGGARLLDFIQPSSFDTSHPAIDSPPFRNGNLPPDFHLTINVSNAETKVKISAPSGWDQKFYVITEALWRYTPTEGGAEVAKALVDFFNEILKVVDEFSTCTKRNNAWGDVGCTVLYERNLFFAVGRVAVNITFKVGVKALVKALLTGIDIVKWESEVADTQKELRGKDLDFTIAAVKAPEPPKQDPPKENPPAENPGDNSGSGQNNPPPANDAPQPEPPQLPIATVQNMHLVGSSGLAEDSTPSYLSTRPEGRCASKGCKIDGTEMRTGDTLEAICWTEGAEVTNENRNSSSDDANPHKITSVQWLKGRKNGAEGFISYIFLNEGSRNLVGHC